jgi:dihydroxyacetone kinase
MKKFINRSEDAVEEMLQGLVVLHPGSARLAGHKVIVRADTQEIRDRQVALISGGGSGHEPAHAGYIGEGMLNAAVLGEVFTSPSSDSVFAAIKAVAGKNGALLVVKNYTGDRLNFGLAAEVARAEGIPVEIVIVDDDVALKEGAQATGARGLAGTVFIHKLVGAAAAEGKSLADLAAIGRAAVASLATMGVSFSAGTSPAVGKPSFVLADHEMELGLGIHGEPGVQRMGLTAADDLTETLLTEILKHGELGEEKRLAVMVNNLGATTEMELAIVARQTISVLEGKGYTVERLYGGTFLSSLDMAGISISVLGLKDEWLRWLDAGTTAPAWPNVTKQRPGKREENFAPDKKEVGSASGKRTESQAGEKTRLAIEAACHTLIEAERELTELDRITGDGDLGSSMERAAKAVQASIGSYRLDDLSVTLQALGHTLRRELGGSSGPLYGIFFIRCGRVVEDAGPLKIEDWARVLEEGCRAISELGGAKPGDRTMLDALDPFVKALRNEVRREPSFEVLMAAVAAAERGAEATAQMKPRLGRSSYLGDRVLGHPDPGAKAVAIWLRAVVRVLFVE